jgi:hypothetical protein
MASRDCLKLALSVPSSGPEKMKPACEKHIKKFQQLLEVHHQDVHRNA